MMWILHAATFHAQGTTCRAMPRGRRADAFLFAVDADFPQALIPPGVGLLLTDARLD